MKRAFSLVCFLGVLASTTAAPILAGGGENAPAGQQQFANLGDFKLRSGEVIRNLQLGYRTAGQLNAEKTNGVVWPTWLGGKTEDLLQYAGPGNVIDTDKYFVVFVDALANGVTTSPSNSKLQPRLKYPKVTIRDMVEAEHKLAADVLGIQHLHAVLGISMGGMQAFEWAAAYPDFMDEVIPIAGSPETTSYDMLVWTTQIDALHLDPEWKNGNGTKPMTTGLLVYNEIGEMISTTPAYRVAKTPGKDFGAYRETIRKEASDARNACDAIRQREAILALDLPGEFGTTMEEVAKRVQARMLIFVSPEDHTVNPTTALEFAKYAGAPVIELDSNCGHQSTACISLGPTVAQFLAAPDSVTSKTLRDPKSK